jgi:hypothetical protein
VLLLLKGLWSFGFAIFFTVLGLWMWFVSERRICSFWGLILQCTVIIAEFHDVGEFAVAAAEL